MTNFERAFSVIVGVEGGYVNDAKDPGGETKYGLSKRANPDLDIKNLTLQQAQDRYMSRYWKPHGLDDLEYGKALLVFDTAVNGGNHERWHGLYSGYPLPQYVENYQAEHALYLASLPQWQTYGRGWARRLIHLSIEALKP
jgi:lysozyme family protein